MAGIERTNKSVPQLAREWGVSTNKILAFVKSGELRAVNLARTTAGRPRYAISLDAIAAFEAARQVVPTTSNPPRRTRRQAASVKTFF